MPADTKYFIAVVSKDHVMKGVQGGFGQAGHGKEAPLKRMSKGDWLIYYSPKESLNSDIKCQSFTALGTTADDEIYQVTVSESFKPFRRNINFRKCKEISILPLIETLSFIKDKSKWGYMFRFGFFEIPVADFELISRLM
ncbi:MAG: EVE domain-containing protein [Ignavibacteria bacterium]